MLSANARRLEKRESVEVLKLASSGDSAKSQDADDADYLKHAAFSASGDILAVGSDLGEVTLWRFTVGKSGSGDVSLKQFSSPSETKGELLLDLQFGASGQLIATTRKNLVIWSTGKEGKSMPTVILNVAQIPAGPGKQPWLFRASRFVTLSDVTNRKTRLLTVQNTVDRRAASSALWDVEKCVAEDAFRLRSKRPVSALATGAEGVIAYGFSNGSVGVALMQAPAKTVEKHELHGFPVTSLAVVLGGKGAHDAPLTVFSGSADGRVCATSVVFPLVDWRSTACQIIIIILMAILAMLVSMIIGLKA